MKPIDDQSYNDYFEVKVTNRSKDRTVVHRNGKWIEWPENISIAMKVSAKNSK